MSETWSHRLKLHRARQHLQTLNAQIASFGERDPYSFVEEHHPERGEHIVRIKINREPPAMWSTTIGDCLQDMRSALDHLAYALAVKHSGEPERPQDIQFPIYGKRCDFRRDRPRRIGLLHPRAQALIQSMQPYRRWQDPDRHVLAVLNDLANIDRHRAIHITPAILTETTVDIASAHNILVENAEVTFGSFEDGTQIARFSIRATGPNAEMHVEVSPEFSIAFDHSGPAKGAFVVESLATLRRGIAEAVFPPLERFL